MLDNRHVRCVEKVGRQQQQRGRVGHQRDAGPSAPVAGRAWRRHRACPPASWSAGRRSGAAGRPRRAGQFGLLILLFGAIPPVRPARTAITGLRRDSRRMILVNFRGLPRLCRYNSTTVVVSSASQNCSRSLPERSARSQPTRRWSTPTAALPCPPAPWRRGCRTRRRIRSTAAGNHLREAGIEADPWVGVDDAHRLGADDPHSRLTGGRHEFCLRSVPWGRGALKPVAITSIARTPRHRAVLDDARHRVDARGDHRQVDRDRGRGDAGIGLDALDLLRLGMHGVDRPVNPASRRLRSTTCPMDPGRRLAPTTAIFDGYISAATDRASLARSRAPSPSRWRRWVRCRTPSSPHRRTYVGTVDSPPRQGVDHPSVVEEHLGVERRDVVLPGDGGQMLRRYRADTAP